MDDGPSVAPVGARCLAGAEAFDKVPAFEAQRFLHGDARNVDVAGADGHGLGVVGVACLPRLYDKGVAIQPGEARYANYAEAMAIRTGEIHIPSIDMQEPLRLECQHFIECLRTGQTPRSDGRDGRAVVRLLEAAQHSLAHNGMKVTLSS